jgi:hypothetical protein
VAEPKTAEQLGPIVSDLIRQHNKERTRLDEIARYMANKVDAIYVPKKATDEYRRLVDMARFNVLPLVVAAKAQNLYVDGYRPTSQTGRAPSADNSPIWDRVWQANRMDARQASLFHPAIKYGYSYATVLPGSGEAGPVITPCSPRTLTALYDDPVNDEWPRFAMTFRQKVFKGADVGTDPIEQPATPAGVNLKVYDDNFIYRVTENGWELDTDAQVHGLGVCPVVRFLDAYGEDDLDEKLELPPGKIEPLLPAQRQLNQTTFGLLMAQQYTAFKQRWATGMTIEQDANGNPVEPFNARVDAVWQNESPDGKFGEFSETNLDGYLNSRDKVLLYISSVAQIPPHNLLVGAGISNISAEALAALESGHRHDISEYQTSFGESLEQLLRLAGRAMGDTEGMAAWDDMSAQVVWRDTTPRSLSQVADALGKLATQLGIPPQALWERIPNVTDQDIQRWTALASERQVMDELEAMVKGGPSSNGDEGDDDVKAKSDSFGSLVRAGVSPESAAAQTGLEGLEFTGAVPVSLRLPESEAADLEEA